MKAFPFSSLISFVLCPLLAVMPVWAQTGGTTDATSTAGLPGTLQIRVVDIESLRIANPAEKRQSFTVEVTDASAPVENAAVVCRLPDSGATGTFADGTHAAVAYTDDKGRAVIEGIQWSTVGGSVAMRLTATKGTAHAGTLVEISLAATTQAQQQDVVLPVPASADTTSFAVPGIATTQAVAAAQTEAVQATPAQPLSSQPAVSVSKPGQQRAQLAKSSPSVAPPSNGLTSTGADPADPTVSVSRTSAADAPHSSHLKWIILAAVVVAAGAGAAFAMKGRSSSSSSNSSAVSIGSPTVSVGQP